MKMLSVYDAKAEVFNTPFFQSTRGLALRAWGDLCNDKGSSVGKYPEDFTLFELGEYDSRSGCVTMHTAPIALGKALEFVRGEEQRLKGVS